MMDFSTKCVHPPHKKYDTTGAVSVPIFQTATFFRSGVGEGTGFDYSRLQNPTREALEETVAALEGGVDALAFSTGMAATTTLMNLFAPGDHLIASADLYGGSHRLFRTISARNQVEITFLDTGDVAAVKKAVLKGKTKALFIETPTNPTMMVTDLHQMSQIAKENGLLLIVDNTFLTPVFQNPISLGAHVVIHSGTKYLGGHNDTLAGFLVMGGQELAEKLRFLYKTVGACLSPFDSWLILRGIKTLDLRMQRSSQTAGEMARWLQSAPHVQKVYYIGLPSHPGYAVNQRQSTGPGAMISFRVDKKEVAHQVLSRVKLIQFAESLGGVESLITYPVTQTHADVPVEQRQALGIDECLLRLSVGIEDGADLIADLEQALRD